MPTIGKPYLLFCAVVAVSLCLTPRLGVAQDKPADQMEMVRQAARAEKKKLIAENMQLTPSEAQAFWPVYDSYQNELRQLNDRSIKLIEDYVKNYQTMSDSVARMLLDEFLAIEADRVKLQQAYVANFMQAVPPKKVARYYQIENKVDAVIAFDLARQIPLVQ
jgi:hypothetical protein